MLAGIVYRQTHSLTHTLARSLTHAVSLIRLLARSLAFTAGILSHNEEHSSRRSTVGASTTDAAATTTVTATWTATSDSSEPRPETRQRPVRLGSGEQEVTETSGLRQERARGVRQVRQSGVRRVQESRQVQEAQRDERRRDETSSTPGRSYCRPADVARCSAFPADTNAVLVDRSTSGRTDGRTVKLRSS